MYFLYMSVFVNKNSCGEEFNGCKLRQGFFRFLFIIDGSGCNQHRVFNAKTINEFLNTCFRSVKVGAVFIGQCNYFNTLTPVLLVKRSKKPAFIHTIGAPAAHDLDDHHFIFVTGIVDGNGFTIDIFKRKIQLAFARF